MIRPMLNIQLLKQQIPFTASIALFLLSTPFLSCAEEYDSVREKGFREKISYHLLIRNDAEAINQANEAVQLFPYSINLRKLYLESLSSLGAEKKLLRAWQQFSRDFPGEKYEDGVLELIAKGVLHNAELSEMYVSKHYRYAVADAFTDASSVESLKEGLQDSNFVVREMALTAALSHGDDTLCDDIVELVKTEKVASVKRKAIEVLLRIKGSEARPLVEEVLMDPNLSYMDRISFLLTILDGKDKITRDELVKLTTSKQTVERLIACYVYSYFSHKEDLDLLKPLLQDPIQDVRIQAITSLGQLHISAIDGESIQGLLSKNVSEGTTEAALLSSWACLVSKVPLKEAPLRDFLYHSNQKIRLQAASLIGYSLPYTQDMAEEFFETHTDPFVRLNLSLSLLAHRKRVPEASDQVFAFLESHESAQFKTSFPYPMETIWPSSLIEDQERMMGEVPGVMQSEIVHFCLLNLMAILEDPRAIDAISNFLDTHHSNVALASLAQFIRAESSHILDLICSFFDHPDMNKRVQAAALVALLKKEEKALSVLYEAYPKGDRQLKEMIIMIVGQMGSKDSIPFLMDAIYEPSQSLRVVAASSLMKCLRS